MIRSRILVISLLALATLAAILGIAEMWWAPLTIDTFIKAMATLLILGVLVSFLVAVDYDLPGSRARILLGLLVALAVLGSFLLVLQIWWQVFSQGMFWKIGVTIVILGAFLSFIMAVSEDFSANKKLRDEKYID